MTLELLADESAPVSRRFLTGVKDHGTHQEERSVQYKYTEWRLEISSIQALSTLQFDMRAIFEGVGVNFMFAVFGGRVGRWRRWAGFEGVTVAAFSAWLGITEWQAINYLPSTSSDCAPNKTLQPICLTDLHVSQVLSMHPSILQCLNTWLSSIFIEGTCTSKYERESHRRCLRRTPPQAF